MRPKFRSISGAALMLVIIPIFAGLLACMPEYVPLGNPERARVDDSMSGMWFAEDAEDAESFIGQIVLLQPWDKRTWLVTTVMIDASDAVDPDAINEDEDEYDATTYREFVDLFESSALDEDALEIATFLYKGWLAKLGGEMFLTWEMRVVVDKPDQLFEPWFWQDFRVTERAADKIVLHLVDTEFPPLKEAPFTKRGWEKVVRKYADDDALYNEDALILRRVKEEDIELFTELVNHALMGQMN